jgi:hypothetical protein
MIMVGNYKVERNFLLSARLNFECFENRLVILSFALWAALRPTSHGPIYDSTNQGQDSEPELDANGGMVADDKYLTTIYTCFDGNVDLTHNPLVTIFYKNNMVIQQFGNENGVPAALHTGVDGVQAASSVRTGPLLRYQCM